ncbi:MAG: hypothetical protein NTW01_09420 [Gammaproteobacteria bacterium]|nr:hypothetical protein [Gammaproteobacteria bacterium]
MNIRPGQILAFPLLMLLIVLLLPVVVLVHAIEWLAPEWMS